MKLKKGDKVIIISGNNKGKTGVIKKILVEKNRVIVDGVGMRKKHVKPSQTNPDGGIVEIDGSINASNVMILTADKEAKRSRVKYAKEGGKKVRVYAKSGQVIK